MAGVELGIPGLSEGVQIGRGGCGVVYKCHQESFRRDVAVKLLDDSVNEDSARRFTRECLAVGTVADHPNIVAVHAAGLTEDRRPYLVMQYVTKGSLWAKVCKDGRLGPQQATSVIIKVAGALHTAHLADILHLDVKPQNILLSGMGEPLLADFGIAQVSGVTATANVGVTLAHGAPEVLDGEDPSPATDVYSLGSTLFALLAGHPAFESSQDTSVMGIYKRITKAAVPDLRPLGVPHALAAVVERAMAKRAEDRYPSAAAMGRALQAVERELGWPVTTMTLPSEEGVPSDEDLDIERTVHRGALGAAAGMAASSLPGGYPQPHAAPTSGPRPPFQQSQPSGPRPGFPPAYPGGYPQQSGPIPVAYPMHTGPVPAQKGNGGRIALIAGGVIAAGLAAIGVIWGLSSDKQDTKAAPVVVSVSVTATPSAQPAATQPAATQAAPAPAVTVTAAGVAPPAPAQNTQPVVATVTRTCGADGTADCFLARRRQPDLNSTIIHKYVDGQTITIDCQTRGVPVLSSVLGARSDVWSRVAGTDQFVANIFLDGPGIDPLQMTLPQC